MRSIEQTLDNAFAIWINHPVRPIVFILYHSHQWQKHYADNLACFMLMNDLTAIGPQVSYYATVEEELSPGSNWYITDSHNRELYLDSYSMKWRVNRVDFISDTPYTIEQYNHDRDYLLKVVT